MYSGATRGNSPSWLLDRAISRPFTTLFLAPRASDRRRRRSDRRLPARDRCRKCKIDIAGNFRSLRSRGSEKMLDHYKSVITQARGRGSAPHRSRAGSPLRSLMKHVGAYIRGSRVFFFFVLIRSRSRGRESTTPLEVSLPVMNRELPPPGPPRNNR